jgi:hypothetical protein
MNDCRLKASIVDKVDDLPTQADGTETFIKK